MKISSSNQSGLYKENQNTVKLMQTYFQSHQVKSLFRIMNFAFYMILPYMSKERMVYPHKL